MRAISYAPLQSIGAVVCFFAELVGLLLVIGVCTAPGPPVVSKHDRRGRSRGGRRPQQRESLLCGVPTRPGAKDAARYERVARSAGAFLAAATVALWSPCGAMGTARRASTRVATLKKPPVPLSAPEA